MKRIVLVHGWMGSPHGDWFPWLKQELAKKRNGFLVLAPAMPDPVHPRIKPWIREIKEAVGKPDEETYFVGHSVGCQAIMRYLETIDVQVGGVIFVAGWFSLAPGVLESKEDEAIARPWLETPINLSKVRQNAKNFVAIFCDSDPWVPLADSKIMARELGAKIIVEHDMGHFSEAIDGVTETPVVLKELLAMVS